MKEPQKPNNPNPYSDNQHKDIPGNPSTAKSSQFKLPGQLSNKTFRVIEPNQWDFWLHNGYVVIKHAIPRQQAAETAAFLWEFEEKDPTNDETWYTSPRAEMEMEEFIVSHNLACTDFFQAIPPARILQRLS